MGRVMSAVAVTAMLMVTKVSILVLAATVLANQAVIVMLSVSSSPIASCNRVRRRIPRQMAHARNM